MLIILKEIDKKDFARALKRLTERTVTAEQAMRNFGKAAKLMRESMPSADDWRKFTGWKR